ncbi:MAG: hypothetical protein CL721_05430 [Chloroflexi bacterium]|nr:hypothetical protein [Chloroflexota bacterium]|tara:strand:- start:12715 stop:13005 length:291 start_codon:yes stop_codon:yes gene_type:complete
MGGLLLVFLNLRLGDTNGKELFRRISIRRNFGPKFQAKLDVAEEGLDGQEFSYESFPIVTPPGIGYAFPIWSQITNELLKVLTKRVSPFLSPFLLN